MSFSLVDKDATTGHSFSFCLWTTLLSLLLHFSKVWKTMNINLIIFCLICVDMYRVVIFLILSLSFFSYEEKINNLTTENEKLQSEVNALNHMLWDDINMIWHALQNIHCHWNTILTILWHTYEIKVLINNFRHYRQTGWSCQHRLKFSLVATSPSLTVCKMDLFTFI